jgi:WD40 repeat protein
MNLLLILIAHAIVALSGAVVLIIFLYFNGPPPPVSIEIDLSPTGEWFLEQKADIERRLHLFTEGELLNKIGHRSLAFSPDGSCLISGSMDKTIRLWDAKSGECLTTIPINSSNQHPPLRGGQSKSKRRRL